MRTLIAISCLALALPAFAQQRGSTKVGDVHVLAVQQKAERQVFDETITVTAIEGDRLRTAHRRSNRPEELQGTYGTDWSTWVSGGSGTRFEPGIQDVKFPLAAGATWEQAPEIRTANGARSQLRIEYRVAGMEKVTTPAGEFDAWRIDGKGYLSGLSWPGGFHVQTKAWYAPAIDRVVRSEYKESRPLGADNVSELKSFKPGP